MDNDRRREALRVRFTADVEADASEVGGGGGGEGGEGGGGRGVMEAGDKFFLKRGLMKTINCDNNFINSHTSSNPTKLIFIYSLYSPRLPIYTITTY